MVGKVEFSGLTAKAIIRVFGIANRTLDDRAVEYKVSGKRRLYNTDDLVAKCGDRILSHLAARDGKEITDASTDLKETKLSEEIRKLKIANDEAEGLLVSAADVEAVFSRSVRAMADELDAVVSRVKMANPDMPQSALAVISEQLDAARRKASRLEFDDLIEGAD